LLSRIAASPDEDLQAIVVKFIFIKELYFETIQDIIKNIDRGIKDDLKRLLTVKTFVEEQTRIKNNPKSKDLVYKRYKEAGNRDQKMKFGEIKPFSLEESKCSTISTC
jgi:hypothetical protein